MPGVPGPDDHLRRPSPGQIKGEDRPSDSPHEVSVSQLLDCMISPRLTTVRTAIWIIEQLSSARFHVEETERGAIIECEGIGYAPPPPAPGNLASPPATLSNHI